MPDVAGPPRKVSTRSWSLAEVVDGVFFVVGTVLVLWLGWVLLAREVRLTWTAAAYLVVFWLLVAYVGLPRLQQVLARVYVPDYYIGRTLTGSGILGDPVNLALDGSEAQLHATMRRAGWTRADEVTLRSSWGIVVSAVLRRSYPAAPVSPLLLFGRREAFAYEQEVGGNAAQRHHVRFWPVPQGWVLPGGHRVGWLAAGTFDRAVGLSLFTLQVTHKVDADIDVERDHVVDTVRSGEPTAVVRVLEDYGTAFHARNGGGDVVRTDGDLVVLDLSAVAAPEVAVPAPPAGDLGSHRLPPPALLAAGTLGVVKAVVGAVGLGLLALPSVAVLLLWLLTLARRPWARALLMLVCTADAAGQLSALSATSGHVALGVLLNAGVSVLILIAVSSDEARRWIGSRGSHRPATLVSANS